MDEKNEDLLSMNGLREAMAEMSADETLENIDNILKEMEHKSVDNKEFVALMKLTASFIALGMWFDSPKEEA